MERSPFQYRSYLLRLWRSGEGETWRAMLEDVASHERHRFADLEELCVFLREQAEASPPCPSHGRFSRKGREGGG